MSTAPTPATIPAPAKLRRRWWLRCAVALAALAAAAFGVYLYLEDAARRDWDAAVAETDRLDPRWRLMDLEADRASVPEAENSAPHLLAIFQRGQGASFFTTGSEAFLEKLPPNVLFNHDQEKVMRSELAKITGPLAEARKLKDMPRGRFAITYTDDYSGSFDFDKSNKWQSIRRAAHWLQMDALLLAHDGKCDDAVDSCLAILHSLRALEGEPVLISQFVRTAVRSIAAASLERPLAQGQASEKTLHAMQSALEEESQVNHVLQGVRGDRAGYHHLFENFRSGKLKSMPADISASMKDSADKLTSLEGWLLETFPSTMLKHYPDFLRHMNRSVEIARLPIHERGPKMAAWEKEYSETKNPLIKILAPRMTKLHTHDCYSQVWLRSAYVALACERYRLRYKDWPKTLDVLVKEKLLAAVPLDPVDGQPLRYRKTRDGVVIYSIGSDLTDNQGNIDRERAFDPGADWGFRLWDVRLRRQPPLAEEEERR